MKHMTLKAPAKINLSLDITGTRTDGYHFLRTVMQSIELFDTVTVTETAESGISVFCDKPDIPCDETNIAHKAAVAFFKQTGIVCSGFRIHIKKVIPAQAGLGGGSADGAAVLAALNALCGTDLPISRLQEIGLSVGADIPFCISGGTALAEGIGEILTPLAGCPDCWLVVCKPPVGVSTAAAYRKFDEVGAVSPVATDSLIGALTADDWKDACRYMKNVFEELLSLPEVTAVESLFKRNGALTAVMSGSGSAVYGVFESHAEALRAFLSCKQYYKDVFICKPYSNGVTRI